MVNLSLREAIKPRSDQLNVEDFIDGERTFQIEHTETYFEKDRVKVKIYFVGGDGRPFKPCVTMIRALVALWGYDENEQATNWVGRWVNLYIDPTVGYGNQKNIGGIRINAVSHINEPLTVKLTVRRNFKQEFTFQPITLS